MSNFGRKQMTTPQFIKRDSMLADTDYVQWLSDLKQRYRQSQAKAAVHVNHGMLEFYWSLGRDIVALKAESKWGSGIINQLSVDLQNLFPSQKGFSARNIWDIKKWYLFYSEQFIKLRQPVAEVEEANRQQPVDEFKEITTFGKEKTTCTPPLTYHLFIKWFPTT